ncbi:Smr/MutS family protein [Mycoplasmopsis glycophila]|uniref:Recombination and DNA strand exchange inhibitor protein n=1 Tax=Mycoplasmopsis glycophila TaxID=171285 RepID=A0A449AW23_9BACT|nr:Smr/MutS family protein [Mycoplasmopsis glycophila]VEU70820.1 recombination and DNA strand exchange inhibitor protein [Mycoplasmopsis glycophila]
MKRVDLHGLESEEAIKEVTLALLDFERNKVTQMLIITGKGTGILQTVVGNILDKKGIKYTLVNNHGAFLIEQQNFIYTQNDDFDDDFADEEEIDDLFNNFKL